MRLLWSLLAALLAGEIIYLIFDLQGPQVAHGLVIVVTLVTAGLVATLFYRTTERGKNWQGSGDAAR